MLATPSRDDRGAIRLAQNAFNGIGKQPPSLRDASNSNTQERTQNAFKALTVGSSLSPSRKSRFGGEMTSTSTTSGSTSDGERLEPEPSNKKAWSGNPTPISAPTRMAPMPERALLPVGSGQQRPTGTRKSQTFRAPVETWRANNGAPRKIQKTVHGEDAPSSSRRQSTSTPKPAQVITIDDDDDDDVVQAVQNRTHTLLGVTPKSPFKDPTPAVTAGVKRPAPSTGTLDEDPIVADEDDDLIIVGGPSTSMRRQSTPDPRGTVVRDTVQKLEALPRAASANLRRVDFDKLQTQNGKKGGLASKMKKKETSASTPASAAPAPALSIEDTLFEGNKASDKSLKQRSSSDPDLQRVWGSAMNLPKHINKLPPAVDFAAKEKDRAAMAKRRERFGSVEKDKEKEPSRVRRSSMNPYGAAAPTVNGRALAPPKSRQPSHGPIPLEALCVGDAAEPGMELMFSVDADGKTLRVLGITEDDEAKEMMWLKVDEIKEVEYVNESECMKKDIGGGLILRVKQPALKRFGLDENTNMIVVIFDKPQPGSAEWNDMKRGKFIQFVHRWQSKSGQVSAETLHAIVNQARAMVDADADLALDLEGEEDEESRRRTVLEQAMIYKDIKIRNSNSNGGSGSATRKRKSVGEEKTLVHYFAKGKGKEVEEEEEIRAVPAKDFYERVQERQASRPRLSRPSSERDELDFLGNDERERARQKQLKEERARAYDRGEAEKGRRMSTRRLKALEQEEEEEEEVKTVAVARKDKEPVKNPDEIVLVYPQPGPGSLNISRGDLTRLEPGEFLNDTLIEWGLKYWLTATGALNPKRAEETHVFSSFFYKKLNQRNFDDGYASVRKWTNKVDIFKKKYIIVPINEHIHWYLAIIYQPEYILRPPPPKKKAVESPARTTRQRKQQQDEEDVARVKALEAQQERDEAPMDVDEPEFDAVSTTASVSAQMERQTLDDSGSGDDRVDPSLQALHEDMESTPEGDDPPLRELLNGSGRPRSVSAGSGRPPELLTTATVADEEEVDELAGDDEREVEEAVGKDGTPPAAEVADDADATDRTTYIFTFDSLGSQHTHTTNWLNKWLQREALDKRGMPEESTSKAVPKKVAVPVQPNYCDCGVYLLHFAETFMENPKKYVDIVLDEAAKKGKDRIDRNALWHNEQVGEKREKMLDILGELSKHYFEEKKKAETEKKEEEEEEDDDDGIVELPPTAPPAVPAPAKKQTLRAGRHGAMK